MKVVLIDTRKLAITIVRNTLNAAGTLDSRYYNPDTQGWEHPFDPAKHLIPTVAMTDPGFQNVLVADIGDVLHEHADAAALIVQPTDGAPVTTIDCWTLPSPAPAPAVGGFLR